MNEWTNKMWYVHIGNITQPQKGMKYSYIQATTWMNFEDILNERSWTHSGNIV